MDVKYELQKCEDLLLYCIKILGDKEKALKLMSHLGFSNFNITKEFSLEKGKKLIDKFIKFHCLTHELNNTTPYYVKIN